MPWWLATLIGAPINALVNLGYKTSAGLNVALFGGAVSVISGFCLLGYGFFVRHERAAELLAGWSPWVIVAMGVGTPAVIFLFISAVTKGPITLVDPLWACIYSLVSGMIGMALLREAPSMAALGGVALYLLGAFLMARG
jgi:drug/metabolite transporter (DMT)-like permease